MKSTFTWQLSNDDQATAASGNDGRYGLLAGVAFGIAGAMLVGLIERLIERSDLIRLIRRAGRVVTWVIAVLAMVAFAVTAFPRSTITLATAGVELTYSCPGPLFGQPSRIALSKKEQPYGRSVEALRSICADDQATRGRFAALTGAIGGVLMMFLIVTRRRARQRLRVAGQARMSAARRIHVRLRRRTAR